MPRYEVKGPDGGTYEINAPDGMSQDAVLERFKSELSKREPTSTASAILQGAGQGITFGFSDEIEAGARAIYDRAVSGKDFSQSYDKRLATSRRRLKRAQDSNPWAYYGAEVGSALVVPGGLARMGVGSLSRAAARQGLGRRMVQGAKEGAAYGAAYGAGTGEGVEGRLKGAGAGAALGGSFGAAVPGAVDLAGATARGIAQPIRGYMNPRRVAAEKYSEALARDFGASRGLREFDRSARRMATRGANASADKPLMSVDLAGENTRRLVRQAADMPSDRAQIFNKRLDQRQASQWRRLERGLADTIGNPSAWRETIEQIAHDRAASARPNFNRAFSRRINFPPRMVEFFERPTMQDILRNVTRNLADEGQSPNALNAMQIVHRTKMELDKQINNLRRAQQMGNNNTAGWDLRTIQGLRRELVDYARQANPDYARALDEYAGASALQGALEDGFENALRMQTEQIPETLRRMSQSEREMWRLGAARDLADKIRRKPVTNDSIKSIFGTADMDLRMRHIFPTNRMRRQFQKQLVEEARMTATRGKVQGNSTTSQNLIQSDEAGKPVRAVTTAMQAMSGRLQPVLDAAARGANRFTGLNPQTAGHILHSAMMPPQAHLGPYVQNAIRRAERGPVNRARLVAPLNAGFAAYRDE